MGWIIGGGVLPACVLATWLIFHRPLRLFLEELNANGARDLFRIRREWLEARFLSELAKKEPLLALLWEDGHWQDEVHWARDRRSRCLLALVAITFESGEPYLDPPRYSTAIFEFRKGRWQAEGKRIDETRPADALMRHQRFEPVLPPRGRA